MTTETRTLALLRHARAVDPTPGQPDRERRLTEAGVAAAIATGRHVHARGWTFDLVVCSDATRTVETLRHLDLRAGNDVSIEADLYDATTPELLTRIRRVPAARRSVLLVGHNPAIHELAVSIADDALPGIDFPPGTLARFRLPIGSWRDLGAGAGALEEFVTLRDLA